MIDAAWIAAGALLVAGWLPFSYVALLFLARMRSLADALDEDASRAADGPPRPPTTVSVVIAARNEERDIEETVRRFLAQRCQGMELVVVDDRSEDGTAEILRKLSAEFASDERLVVVRNRELPPGRLGKCHAASLGAARTRGEWILFADGDVSMATDDLLSRVVAYAERTRLDHLTLLPDMGPQDLMQEALTGAFALLYLTTIRAWRTDRDDRRGGGGVGAFNLVRREAYRRVGGHDHLMMDTADDWKLGRILKESGARQAVFFGRGLVLCPWHRGLRNVVRGLEKNAFGGCDYKISSLLLATVGIGVGMLGPPLLAVLAFATGAGSGSRRVAAAVSAPILVQLLFSAVNWAAFRERTGARLGATLLFPAGMLLFLTALWRSAAQIIRRGGVLWRGTFYSLADLRRGLVPVGFGRRFAR